MSKAEKILLVDDDQVARKLVRQMLEESGYNVVEGENGRDALRLARSESPDLLLLDVEMPMMSGHEVCRILKAPQNQSFMPIIMLTARSDLQTKVDGLELGADDYLTKPVNKAELLARLRSMLRLKRLQDDLLQANDALKKVNEKLQEMSTIDPLMGVFNRLYFEKRLKYEFQRAFRYRSNLSLLMMDLDHFKQVNDTYGHPFGDFVLKEVAKLVTNTLRKVDIVARYGGEEIVIACPETDENQAQIVAERVRQVIEKHSFTQGETSIRMTISIGIAVFPTDGAQSETELVKMADSALYRAKADGRNRHRRYQPQ